MSVCAWVFLGIVAIGAAIVRHWWRKMPDKYEADIPANARSLFERWGKDVIRDVLIGMAVTQVQELIDFSNDLQMRGDAFTWLREIGADEVRREKRLEIVEWAILGYLIVSVLFEIICRG